jgi:predicted ester cyclase
MKSVLALLAISAAGCGGGCNKKKPEEDLMPAPPAPAATTGSGSGSAAAPPKLTAEDVAKRFDQCWRFFNDSKWDDFKTCYADGAVASLPGAPIPDMNGAAAIVDNAKQLKATFPDMHGEPWLELVSDHTLIGVTLLTGTMTGDFKGPIAMPATKNKIGLLVGQVIELDGGARAIHEADFYDLQTLLGQMKPDPKRPVRPIIDDRLPMPKEVLVTKDVKEEKANLATATMMMNAFSAHDAKIFGELLADDVRWIAQSEPKDLDKKGAVANAQALWKGFSDVRMTADKQWAAGDYVATVGAFDATNDGDVPEMHLKKTGKKVHIPFLAITRLEGGKIKALWLNDQALAMETQLGLTTPAPAPPPTPAAPGSAAPAPAPAPAK